MQRITVNMAPADIPKEGGRFDLAIAVGILAASGQIRRDTLNTVECVGELSLGGALRPIAGVLPIAAEALDLSFCPLGVTGEPWVSQLLEQPGLSGVGGAFVGTTPSS